MMRRWWSMATCLCWWSARAACADGDLAGGHGAAYYLANAALSLTLVVALIYASYYLLRRLQGNALPGHRGAAIEIVDARSLGGGRWLYLVEVEGARFLIGGTGASVGPIQPLNAAAPVSEAIPEGEASHEPQP